MILGEKTIEFMERGLTHGELNEAEDKHGPEASKVRVGEEATEEGEKEDGTDEVGDDVGGFGQREVHLVEYICYQIVADPRDRHHLKRLETCVIINHAPPTNPTNNYKLS